MRRLAFARNLVLTHREFVEDVGCYRGGLFHLVLQNVVASRLA
jgi:hypothetical protein